MSLCICVCANDGRVNSIAIPLPFRFPLYFPTIRRETNERNSKKSENESLFEDDRFQGTRERIRFDFLRVHAFRNAPNSRVSFRIRCWERRLPFHFTRESEDASETRYRYRSFRCYVMKKKKPCTRREKERDEYKETSITLDEQQS